MILPPANDEYIAGILVEILDAGDDLLGSRSQLSGEGLLEITIRRKGLPIGRVAVRLSGPDGGRR